MVPENDKDLKDSTFWMPYHPQGNAVIESARHRIKTILRAQQSVKYPVQQRCDQEVLQRRRVHLENLAHELYPLTSYIGRSCMVCDTSELRTYPSKALAPRSSGPWIILGAVTNVVASVRSNFKHRGSLQSSRRLLFIPALFVEASCQGHP